MGIIFTAVFSGDALEEKINHIPKVFREEL